MDDGEANVPDQDIKELSPTEVHPDLDRYRLIDVREPFEFRGGPLGHVAGSEQIHRSALPDRVASLRGRPVLFVCRSGRRSADACRISRSHGLDEVTNLAGGMIAWLAAELPAVRTPAATARDIADALASWAAMLTMTPLEATLERWPNLRADTADDDPSLDSLGSILDALEEQLRTSGNPPDLAISVKVFREDLAALAHATGLGR